MSLFSSFHVGNLFTVLARARELYLPVVLLFLIFLYMETCCGTVSPTVALGLCPGLHPSSTDRSVLAGIAE